jgi:hypothetical protein
VEAAGIEPAQDFNRRPFRADPDSQPDMGDSSIVPSRAARSFGYFL